MADKSIDQLNAAEKIYATDLFVLQQSGSAKKLTGQVLLNWLTAAADGHGGIQSIAKRSTSGLVDTYRITLADTTTFDFVVTNGRSITGISKTSTSGLVDTYTISYNNGATSKFTVTNGEKGDKGDNAHVWIKYASQEPTESSHSMGDAPDDWIGIYSGNVSTAPTDWKQYKWYKIKGKQGDPGAAATLVNKSVTYQVSDSGTIIPSGTWVNSVPVASQGKYLWTKTELQFNTGAPIISYSVARMGIDGSGSVSSVAGVSPDATGNVTLTAADVGALAVSGGDMEGAINMNGQAVTGLNAPTEDTDAARKGYVDSFSNSRRVQNLLDNSDFRNPVNQRGYESGAGVSDYDYFLDRWKHGIAEKTNYTLSSAGLGIPSGTYIFQVNETIRSGTYTFAVKQSDGSSTILNCVVSFAADGSWKRCGTIAENGIGLNVDTENGHVAYIIQSYKDVVVEWAAFYEGSYTADTLPPYVPNGYGAELLECQRYYVPNTSTAVFVPANGYLAVYFPVDMRLESPTITAESSNDNDCTVSLVSRRGFVLVNNNAAISQIYWEASADL